MVEKEQTFLFLLLSHPSQFIPMEDFKINIIQKVFFMKKNETYLV